MKYFTLIILPNSIDPLDTSSIERVAAEMMNLFKMREDDTPVENAHWDYYWCCTKEWMDQSQLSYSTYVGVPPAQPLVVFPVDQLTAEGVTYSVLTPNGEWHRSKATYEREDSSWEAEALRICRAFAGHFAVLAYCHG
ncbi:hypothetical protein AB6Q13_11500 [Ralstonia solanacearum]|uniref:hypothetical protein n=1 Tax=Ralstonia solanacearum TaxID=305 RepID=UPI001FFAFAA1|nr:hypothetical protein [Ralstonia solanacearum]MDB0566546.1 hypothetical protein [Ralstonia solanacearum]MDB0575771.1 hypothetical protein [Ralstonia solanacearum]